MKIREIRAKTILHRTKIPGMDFSINPYIGCQHGCIYCYASYMGERFGHRERWGSFVDVKVNAAEILRKRIERMRKRQGTIAIGVSTDPYQPVERKYRITRAILEVLRETDFRISLLTKSPLVLDDFHLISSFGSRFHLGVSISVLSPELKRFLEPASPDPILRLKALAEFNSTQVKNFVFFSPLIPGFSDQEGELEFIFRTIREFGINRILVDRMSLYSNVMRNFAEKLRRFYPQKYKRLMEYRKNKRAYLKEIKGKIISLSRKFTLPTEFTF